MQYSKRVKNTFIEEDFKKADTYALIILIFLTTILINTFIKIEYKNIFSFNEYDYWNTICVDWYWENSYYVWEFSDDSYLCLCKVWYEFWWEDDNTCVEKK